MAGKIKNMIDTIVDKRSNGNSTVATLTKSKMVMKGINPEKYTRDSADDPQVIEKLTALAREWNVKL